eukprot:15460193-Alexandrium_andersonii.AAC.1
MPTTHLPIPFGMTARHGLTVNDRCSIDYCQRSMFADAAKRCHSNASRGDVRESAHAPSQRRRVAMLRRRWQVCRWPRER